MAISQPEAHMKYNKKIGCYQNLVAAE